MAIIEFINKIIDFIRYVFTVRRTKEQRFNEWLTELRSTTTQNPIVKTINDFDKRENLVRMERILSLMEQGCRNYIRYRFDRKSFKNQLEEDIELLFKDDSITSRMIYKSSGYTYLKRYNREILGYPYSSRNKIIVIILIFAILIIIFFKLFF